MSKVIMLCGRLCSGKTTYAKNLSNELGAVILSIDELMLTLLGNETGKMHDEYVRRSKEYLFKKASEIVNAGANVILDIGLWSRDERKSARLFFALHETDCEIHYLKISDEEWLKRIEKRNSEITEGKSNSYFVDDGLKAKFISMFEAPDNNEADLIIEV